MESLEEKYWMPALCVAATKLIDRFDAHTSRRERRPPANWAFPLDEWIALEWVNERNSGKAMPKAFIDAVLPFLDGLEAKKQKAAS